MLHHLRPYLERIQVLLAEKTDEQHFAEELTMLAAVKLYELGRLSSGRAAELAGTSRVDFLSALGRYNVFPMQHELEELEAELNAEEAGGKRG